MNNFKINIFKTVEETTSVLPLTTYWLQGVWAAGTHLPGGSFKVQNEYRIEEWVQEVFYEMGCLSYTSSIPPYERIGMQDCTPPGNNYKIVDCETSFFYNCAKGSSNFAIGDIIEFIPIADDTLIRCGTVASVTYNSSSPDCTITGMSRGDCGDTIHCGVSNPNRGLT